MVETVPLVLRSEILKTRQHWIRLWPLGAVKQCPCHHMVSLGHNELNNWRQGDSSHVNNGSLQVMACSVRQQAITLASGVQLLVKIHVAILV